VPRVLLFGAVLVLLSWAAPAESQLRAVCSAAFATGASVTLTAAPAGGAGFVRWTGACSGTLPDCAVIMSGSLTATATFGRIFTDDPLGAATTVLKAAHMLELRAAIDSGQDGDSRS
jgi:List-Bact-rpt repeat protein